MKFPARQAIIILSNTLLSMPPVVIGLIIYILVSQSGPLGWTGILYTPYAMALAQTVLVLPISIALSRQVFGLLNTEYNPLFMSLGTGRWRHIKTLVFDARIALVTIALASFWACDFRRRRGDYRWRQYPPCQPCYDRYDSARNIKRRIGCCRKRHRVVNHRAIGKCG